MAMFCHPFMAHHGLQLMTSKTGVITHGMLSTMKNAFVDDVKNGEASFTVWTQWDQLGW